MSTASPEACANLDDVLYWCFITMKQVERLYEFFAMYTKESSSDEKVTGYSPEQQRISILVAGDIHFLLTAVTNLIKATSKRLLPDDVKKARLDIAASEKVEYLRNIYEHWEKTKEAFSKNREKSRSAKWYEDNYSNRTPWSLSWDANGFVVGDILNINELGRDATWLALVLSNQNQYMEG